MTTKHTQGPWKANGQKVYASLEGWPKGAPNDEVLIVSTHFRDKATNRQIGASAAEANARLIAAAPDLLALIETINEAAQGHVQINQHWLETATRAAIAKAKGE